MGCENTIWLLTLIGKSYIIIGVFVVPKNRIMNYVEIAQTLMVWAFFDNGTCGAIAKKPKKVDKTHLKQAEYFTKTFVQYLRKIEMTLWSNLRCFFIALEGR